MTFLRLLLITAALIAGLTASELSEVVMKFQAPTLESAKGMVEDLEGLIETGDARTVTLSKKVHRSVKRIFKAEQELSSARAEALRREARAKQLSKNAKAWLKPNAHGKVNRGASDSAKREAMALRQESKEEQISFSQKWAEEVADFEKMLGDLEFSKEKESLHVMAGALLAIVKRTSWVDKPSLKYSSERLTFLKDQFENQEYWVTLARHAAEAGDLDLSYDLYRKAGSQISRFKVGARLAQRLVEDGYPGTAKNLYARIGATDRVAALRAQYPSFTEKAYRRLDASALARQSAPACVRVVAPDGHLTGFFYKAGGHLLTCRRGLLNDKGDLHPLSVVLEDGRKFSAKVVSVSEKKNLIALKIDLESHEILPMAEKVDLQVGNKVTVLGFKNVEKNVASPVSGTLLSLSEMWQDHPAMGLALDAAKGLRGGPILDDRGRFHGVLFHSLTGSASFSETGALQEFVKSL